MSERCGIRSAGDPDSPTCGALTSGHGVTLSVDPELAPGVELVSPARIPLCDEHYEALRSAQFGVQHGD